MDFFEHQDVARKQTGRLVLLFACAVACIGVVLYLVGVLAVGFLTRDPETGATSFDVVNPIAAVFALGTLLVIVGGGTLYKLVQLRAGGRVVAEHLGGRLLRRDTRDPGERQLLNIVEEMALASGTPVPPVYLMDHERGLNAFAAGYSPDSAVIGVTRGAIDHFSRAQMQGVIAHEFSHILNGDMRLNIRLIGVLHGILLLGIVGSLIIRSFFYASVAGGRRSSNDKGGGQAMIVIGAVALIFIVLGAVGTFFGTWIKSAVSRQREYLADASAVQFTRDPQTIAGALRSIGGFKHRSRIDSPHAPEASHMFFGQAITSGFNSMFATHPPLPDRIRRVDPSWDGTFPMVGDVAYPEVHGGEPAKQRSSVERLQDVLPIGVPGVPGEGAGGVLPAAAAVAMIGTIDEAHVQHAQSLLRSIPGPIRDATNDAFSARAVVFGLLLHEEGPARDIQLRHLKANAAPSVVRALAQILPSFEGLSRELRLPILDIATPSLASMMPKQARTFYDNACALAEADEKIDVFEWALLRIVGRRLAAVLGEERQTGVAYYALHKLGDHLSVVLSVLARVGHSNEEHARTAFQHAAAPLRVSGMSYLGADDASLDRLGEALDTLERTAPRPKKQIIMACATCVAADRTVTPNEAELFRVIADELGVPTPPVLPGQRLV